MAVGLLIGGLLSTSRVVAANILGNPGFEAGNFTNWTTFGPNNYVLSSTQPCRNGQWSTDTAVQNRPLFP